MSYRYGSNYSQLHIHECLQALCLNFTYTSNIWIVLPLFQGYFGAFCLFIYDVTFTAPVFGFGMVLGPVIIRAITSVETANDKQGTCEKLKLC